MRGESKYHYVDFELVDEDIELSDTPPQLAGSVPPRESFDENMTQGLVKAIMTKDQVSV